MTEKVYTNCTNSGPVSVYVKDGKITRIRPLVADPKDYRALGDRGRRQEVLSAQEGHACSLCACRAAPHLLRRTHPLSHEARGLRPQRRAQSAEPRQVSLRAHLLGRSRHHRGRRDQAGARDLRRLGHKRSHLLAPQLGHRRLQDGPVRPLPQHGRGHAGAGQPRQLGRLALGRDSHLRLPLALGHARALRHARGRPAERRDDRLLVQRPRHHSRHLLRSGLRYLAAVA